MKRILLLTSCLITIVLFNEGNAQSSYQFTTAGASGANGPSQVQLNAAYSGTNLQSAVTSSNGIQEWVVPSSGTYSIQANGAQGGGPAGGLGASMQGEFDLLAGQTLYIIVGQEGETSGGNRHAGGGASYVVEGVANNILVIAGGGGGASSSGAMTEGTIALNGQNGDGASQGLGGLNGQGGAGASCRGGGGAGWLSAGTVGGCGGAAGQGGIPFSLGGQGGGIAGVGSEGGFGGGGSSEGTNAAWSYCAGGGGYSGGGGGSGSATTFRGGGGGSINNGLNQVNASGVQSGDGTVTITALTSPAPDNAGVNFFVNPTFVNGTVCAGFATVEAVIQNYGSNQINSLNVDWTYAGVAQPSVSYSSLLDTFGGLGNSTDTVTLGTINITGNSEIVAWTSMPNGNMDTLNGNDTASLAIDSVITILLDLGPDKTVCDGSFVILENVGSSQTFTSYSWSTGSNSPTIITNSPGTYSVTVTYGPPQCLAADQIVVIGAANPNVDLGPDSIYCANEFTLDAGGDGTTYVWSDGTSTQTNTVTVSGNYSVTVTSDDGCIVEDDINLTLLETPVVDLGEDFKLCISYDQTQLISAGNSFESYIWSTGATTPNIVVGAGVTTVGNQTYSVTVTANNGCTGEDAVTVEYSMCVGLIENSNNSNVSLFPNPAADLVTFTAESTDISEVQIFDLTGKLIFSKLPASNRLEVNTSSFASGSYIVKVITENESVTRRLIVQ